MLLWTHHWHFFTVIFYDKSNSPFNYLISLRVFWYQTHLIYTLGKWRWFRFSHNLPKENKENRLVYFETTALKLWWTNLQNFELFFIPLPQSSVTPIFWSGLTLLIQIGLKDFSSGFCPETLFYSWINPRMKFSGYEGHYPKNLGKLIRLMHQQHSFAVVLYDRFR